MSDRRGTGGRSEQNPATYGRRRDDCSGPEGAEHNHGVDGGIRQQHHREPPNPPQLPDGNGPRLTRLHPSLCTALHI